MKAVSNLRPAAWAGVITVALGMQTALAEPLVYVPLGGEGKIVVIDAAKDEIVGTISRVTARAGSGRPEDYCDVAREPGLHRSPHGRADRSGQGR